MIRFRVLCLLCGLIASVHAQTNLVPNGNFNQKNTVTGWATGWNPYVNPITGQIPPVFQEQYLSNGGPDGSACVLIGHSSERWTRTMVRPTEENYAQTILSSNSPVPLNPQGYYKLTLQYKTQDITDQQTALTLYFVDTNKSKVGKLIHYLPPSPGWGTFQIYFKPIKATDRGFSGKDSKYLLPRLGVVNSLGNARFDNFTIVSVSQSEYQSNLPLKKFTAPDLLQARAQNPHFAAAPYFTVQRDARGAWWFVRPDGSPFWQRSVQDLDFTNISNPYMFQTLPAYYKLGGLTNDVWLNDSMRRLGMLGFNSSALPPGNEGDTSLQLSAAYFHPLNLIAYQDSFYLKDANGHADPDRKPMQDPYNPQVQAWIPQQVQLSLDSLPSGWLTSPKFAGYFTENEIAVEELDRFIWTPYCAAQFANWVAARYNYNIQTVNHAWSSQYVTFTMTSFDDIWAWRDKITIHHLDDPLAADLNAFVAKMLKDYYRLICTSIRNYEVSRFGDSDGDGLADVHHLISTNKYGLSGYPHRNSPDIERAVTAVGELQNERPGYYYNFVSIVEYPGDALFEGINTPSTLQMNERLAGIAHLPIYISEYAVHGRDSGIPTGTVDPAHLSSVWYKRSVDTQADRGMFYEKNIRAWASSPNVIGAQWLALVNGYQTPDGSPGVPVNTAGPYYKGKNTGFMDDSNQYYTALTNKMALTNMALDQAFYGRPSTVSALDLEGHTAYTTDQTATLHWTEDLLYGPVKIMLYRPSGQWLRTMTQTVDGNAGTWSYSLYGLPAGDYQFKLKSVVNEGIKSYSPTFNVAPGASQPWVQIARPVTAISFHNGDKYQITWTSGNLTGNVRLSLYWGSEFIANISSPLDVKTGKFLWSISAIPARTDYAIRIKSELNGNIKDSSAPVTILQ